MFSLGQNKGLAVLAFTTLLLASCSQLHRQSALDHLHPCKSSEGPSTAYCGTLDVFENRDAQAGRKIALKIVVLPALKQHFAPDPVFFLAGGPGQGAASLAEYLGDTFRELESSRDIVLVDQRGTGKSNPLECKPAAGQSEEDEDLTSAQEQTKALALYHSCLDSYRDKADVRFYTTNIAMDDIDEVRQFLGYSKINLYGISYGTRAALVYARRHPAATRSVILDAVAPTGMQLPLYTARDAQRALDRLFSDCEKDSACHKRFPNLRGTFQQLMARLTAHPEQIHYIHPRTGESKEFDVKRIILSGVVFKTLYNPDSSSLLPLLIEQAGKGTYAGFIALAGDPDPKDESQLARGMQVSVICSEDATRIPPGSLAKEAAGSFMETGFADAFLLPCSFWPKGQVESTYFDIAPSDLPALIFSGELDPITPPVWGQQVAAQWKNSKHVVVPGSAHGAFSHGCVMKLMSQFLDAGSATHLDTACVNQIKRPPFFLGPAGPDPLAGGSAQ